MGLTRVRAALKKIITSVASFVIVASISVEVIFMIKITGTFSLDFNGAFVTDMALFSCVD
jgi:hypothetical protein